MNTIRIDGGAYEWSNRLISREQALALVGKNSANFRLIVKETFGRRRVAEEGEDVDILAPEFQRFETQSLHALQG